MNFFYVKKQRYTSAGNAPAVTYHSREHRETTVHGSAISQQSIYYKTTEHVCK